MEKSQNGTTGLENQDRGQIQGSHPGLRSRAQIQGSDPGLRSRAQIQGSDQSKPLAAEPRGRCDAAGTDRNFHLLLSPQTRERRRSPEVKGQISRLTKTTVTSSPGDGRFLESRNSQGTKSADESQTLLISVTDGNNQVVLETSRMSHYCHFLFGLHVHGWILRDVLDPGVLI